MNVGVKKLAKTGEKEKCDNTVIEAYNQCQSDPSTAYCLRTELGFGPIEIYIENGNYEELKMRIISHMALQSLDMEMSISNIRIEEVDYNAC